VGGLPTPAGMSIGDMTETASELVFLRRHRALRPALRGPGLLRDLARPSLRETGTLLELHECSSRLRRAQKLPDAISHRASISSSFRPRSSSAARSLHRAPSATSSPRPSFRHTGFASVPGRFGDFEMVQCLEHFSFTQDDADRSRGVIITTKLSCVSQLCRGPRECRRVGEVNIRGPMREDSAVVLLMRGHPRTLPRRRITIRDESRTRVSVTARANNRGGSPPREMLSMERIVKQSDGGRVLYIALPRRLMRQ
jgi:hypothetical protein